MAENLTKFAVMGCMGERKKGTAQIARHPVDADYSTRQVAIWGRLPMTAARMVVTMISGIMYMPL